MQNVFRILTVVLATQSVGCAMLVGNPNPTAVAQDEHGSHNPVAPGPNATMPNYEGNVVAWQYSPIVARSTANNSSLSAKATELVESDRAAKQEARRQRDQRFAEVQKEVSAQLQQRQLAPVVTEAFPPPSLPVDTTSTSTSIEPLRREVKKKLYLDDAQFQPATSTTVSPIAVAPQPWQSISARPLAIVTMVVLVLSGVTWPLTRSQRIVQLFARFHRSEEDVEVESTLDQEVVTAPSVAPSETVPSCADDSLLSGLDCKIEFTNLEAESCFSSCDPIAEDKQAWLSEFESVSTDFMVVCVDSWSQNDLMTPPVQKAEQFKAEEDDKSVPKLVTEPKAEAIPCVEANTSSDAETVLQTNSSEPESTAADTVLPVTDQCKAPASRALIAVNKRILIGSPIALPAPASEYTETGTCEASDTSSTEASTTARVSGYIAANLKPRGVSLLGLPAKGPAKPVYPKLMPPVQVQEEAESQDPVCVDSACEEASRESFQDVNSIGSAQKFVGFVVLFDENGKIGSFKKMMIVESFQLKDHSELTANVVRVA